MISNNLALILFCLGLDVSIDMPDEIDLTAYRGQGLQEGEVELPEGGGTVEPGKEMKTSVEGKL